MPSITIKNIPEHIYNRLKEQANAQHRSINSQIIAYLEKAVEPNQVSSEEILYNARSMRNRVKGSLDAEEIQKAIDEGRP